MAVASALRENAVTRLATSAKIDAKSVAKTSLYVVPTGKSLIVDHINIRVADYTAGTKDTQAKASFGTGANNDDYLKGVTYTVAAVGKVLTDNVLDAFVPVYAAGSDFKISIETGSNATTENWIVDVFGYLV